MNSTEKALNTMDFRNLPFMLYSDDQGNIYEHHRYRMTGSSALSPGIPEPSDIIPLPEFSKLFYIPDCPPVGLDPSTGKCKVIERVRIEGRYVRCNAVAAFLEPGFVRTLLPSADYKRKTYVLPMWAYTAVGWKGGSYYVTAFQIEYSRRWDPKNYDDHELIPAIERYRCSHTGSGLVEHLVDCATVNHCFAAKNLFLGRWEAPLPVSRRCNARCLGCLSLQSAGSCEESHKRLRFRPSKEEIVDIAVRHLEGAEDAIVSFGQGCEGEPLTEHRLIAESIREIRKRTSNGTINLNTNGSLTERVREIALSGLDSIRISLNSARPDFYRSYYRPKGYDFQDVIATATLCRELGLYTMINYLVFPGITDQEEEMKDLIDMLRGTGVNFLHLKNLNIDPEYYVRCMPKSDSPFIGLKQMAHTVAEKIPGLRLGYFNQPVR